MRDRERSQALDVGAEPWLDMAADARRRRTAGHHSKGGTRSLRREALDRAPPSARRPPPIPNASALRTAADPSRRRSAASSISVAIARPQRGLVPVCDEQAVDAVRDHLAGPGRGSRSSPPAPPLLIASSIASGRPSARELSTKTEAPLELVLDVTEPGRRAAPCAASPSSSTSALQRPRARSRRRRCAVASPGGRGPPWRTPGSGGRSP